MKKFFIGLGIFFVLAGIVFCAADTKDTSARAQALYDAPVVTMQDLEEWKNQDTQQEVVVTQIPLTGDLVSRSAKVSGWAVLLSESGKMGLSERRG